MENILAWMRIGNGYPLNATVESNAPELSQKKKAIPLVAI
jgi:hypothetical protein